MWRENGRLLDGMVKNEGEGRPQHVDVASMEKGVP